MLGGLFLLLWLDDAAQRWTRAWMQQRYGGRGGVGGIGLFVLLVCILPLAVQEIEFDAPAYAQRLTVTITPKGSPAGDGSCALHTSVSGRLHPAAGRSARQRADESSVTPRVGCNTLLGTSISIKPFQ